MRTRAYRPEVPGCLEDRSLLSSVAGLSADPIVLTRREFNLIPEQIQEAFQFVSPERRYSPSSRRDS